MIGGTTEDGNTADVNAYDPETDTWTPRAPLPEPRFNHSALELGGKIYVLGGYLEGQERRDVFVYDPAADSWSEGPELPMPNHAFDAVAVDGEIWMIGGRSDDEILRDVWILDVETGRWRRGPEMPEPMELLGAAVAGDEIHAIWESTYQVYDTTTGRWTNGPRSLVTRHGLQTFYIDGVLFTVGGCTTRLVDSPIVERRVLHVALTSGASARLSAQWPCGETSVRPLDWKLRGGRKCEERHGSCSLPRSWQSSRSEPPVAVATTTMTAQQATTPGRRPTAGSRRPNRS